MSIEEKDKANNERPEEDTLALRAISGGNRKSKKSRQVRAADQTADQSSSTPADDRSSETKQKSNGTGQKVAPPAGKSGKEAISDIAKSSDDPEEQAGEEKEAASARPVGQEEPVREPIASASEKGIAAAQPEAQERPATPEVPQTSRLLKEEATSAVPKPQAREASAPAIPKRPQTKGQSAPAIPKRPQAQGQAATSVPKTPRIKEEAAPEPVARKEASPEKSLPDQQNASPLPEKQAANFSTAALSKQEVEERLAASLPQKDIADISTTAISKQEVEEGLAAALAQKEDIAEQPTTAMPDQKASGAKITEQSTTATTGQETPGQKLTEQPATTLSDQHAPGEKLTEQPITSQETPEKKIAEQPAPVEAEKHIADISTVAISKQEVQEQLAAARAKKELEKKTARVVPEQKKDGQKEDIAEQPTRIVPGPKAEELPDTPPLEKHVADISTTAISKQEVEEGLAAALAQKKNGSKPASPPQVQPGKENGRKPAAPPQAEPKVARTPDKGVAVLTQNAAQPGVITPARLDPAIPAISHRTRINRMLIRKRRQERTKEIAPRLVTVAAIILILVTSLFSSSAGAAYAYYESQLPLLNGIATHSLFQTTHIYDRNGNLLYELYDQQLGRGRRTYVNYNDISPLLINATVAIEDRTFWTNNGVDPVGIARASVELAQNNGDVQGGGSTITQQLIKNQFFDNEPRTFQLKGEEAMLAAGLTQQYPKWKIMEMYLNTVYYGDINYGAEAAAEDYFGLMPKCDKTRCIPGVAQLDLAQASLLAGLPQSPSDYDPINNKSAALARQKAVLQALVETGKITPVQAQQAANEMTKYNFISYAAARRARPQAPHFVSYVIDQLTNLLGAQTLVSGGFNVYTTLDLDLEKKVEQIVYYHIYQQQDDNYVGFYGILSRNKNVNNGAVVVMNPYNGEILAMDGSADYNANNPTINGQVNAALTLRQPGSSMKPIVYATAFEMGWSPGMIVPDHKTIYPYPDPAPPQYYTPQNYDGTFHTSFPMTIRTAVSNSYNIPALDTLMYAGIPNVQNMAGRLGLPEIANAPASQLGVSLALGAREVSLLHLTNAYATFANQGVHVPPTSILEITDNQGHPLYKYDESHPQGTRAVGADVAFLINSMLSDKAARYHEFSPGNPLELDRPAAAKTGTTDSFRDNWTMGYTPHLAVGVWVGNSDNEIMNNIIGITGAGPIWHDVMEYASQRYNFPPDDFVRPSNVNAGTVSAATGLVPRPGEETVTDWYIDGTLPTIQGSNYWSSTPSCTKRHCNNNNNNNNGG